MISQQYINNQARGVLWGAVLGDVIGAYLQFNRAIDNEKVKEAFLIKGGGMHKLEPGQPTDDSELSYALAKGLIRGKGKLNMDLIAQQMGNWFLSKPIDVGGTIRKSVPKACNMKNHQAYLCRKAARQCSKQSQSNGTLMCISPLALWCRKLSSVQIMKSVKQFTILIHPNELVVLSNSFYVLMLVYMLNHQEKQGVQTKINSFYYAKQQIDKIAAKTNGKKQFDGWIETIQKSLKDFNILLSAASPVKSSGWVRVALSYSIYYLIKGESFSQSLFQILSLKGDTDTNACISGALMGAYYSIQGLNLQNQIKKINEWRPKVSKRPEWLVPGLVIQKFVCFLEQCTPTQLKIVGGEQQTQTSKTIEQKNK